MSILFPLVAKSVIKEDAIELPWPEQKILKTLKIPYNFLGGRDELLEHWLFKLKNSGFGFKSRQGLVFFSYYPLNDVPLKVPRGGTV